MSGGKKGSGGESEGYQVVGLDLIDMPEDEDRLEMPVADLEELADSIAEIGLLQAVVINRKGERYQLIAGKRRILAHEKIGKKEIRADVICVDDETAAVMRATENLQRRDLSPIEEGRIYCSLYDKRGLTVKMIARRVGKSEMHVKRKMDLLRLDSELQAAIHYGRISEGVANALARIEDKKDLYRYLEMAIENGITTKVANLWVDEIRKNVQYLDNREMRPQGNLEVLRESKSYATCDTCEGPVEYKDMKMLRICGSCLKVIMGGIEEGVFKEGGD